MRTSTFLTFATLAAQAISAVPHRKLSNLSTPHTIDLRVGRDQAQQHKNLHLDARDIGQVAGIATVTKTIIEPSAIIWVDAAGNTVSTEFRAPSPPTPAPNANNNPAPAASATAPGQFNQITNQGQVGSPAAQSSPVAASPAAMSASGNGGYGICYDLITSSSACKTAAQIDSDFKAFAAAGYKMVRTYDIGCDTGLVTTGAAAHGLKVFAGINGVGNVAGDLAKLIGYISAANGWAVVDTINIGNEQVNQGVAASTVIAAVNQGRGLLQAAGFKGNVVTVEVFNSWTPELAAASDYVAANAHGYFDTSNSAANNGKWLQGTYDKLTATAGGKKVVITESGWPHGGSPNGNAVASPQDQTTAIAALKAAFANNQDSLYLFQAYDATYKKSGGSLGIEMSFGIFGTD